MMTDGLTLLAEFQIRQAAVTRDEWLQVWNARAQDAFDHEPETLAYCATVPIEHDDRVMIFERYKFGDDSLARHMDRRAHEQLLEEMTARNMTKRRVSLAWLRELSDWGRWAPVDDVGADTNHVTLTVTGIRVDDQGSRDQFVEDSRQIANEHLASTNGTVVLGLGEIVRPDARNPELAIGDLVAIEIALTDVEGQSTDWREFGDTTARYRRAYQAVPGGYLWRTLEDRHPDVTATRPDWRGVVPATDVQRCCG